MLATLLAFITVMLSKHKSSDNLHFFFFFLSWLLFLILNDWNFTVLRNNEPTSKPAAVDILSQFLPIHSETSPVTLYPLPCSPAFSSLWTALTAHARRCNACAGRTRRELQRACALVFQQFIPQKSSLFSFFSKL